MRKRARKRARAQWESQAAPCLPAFYPGNDSYVLRSPLIPTLIPSRIRFISVDDARGSRPTTKRLEAALQDWLLRVIMNDMPDDNRALAGLMAEDVKEGETVKVALVGGAGDHEFTHFTGWRPDDRWFDQEMWSVRVTLVGTTAAEYESALDQMVELLCLPEAKSQYRSVLVACPAREVAGGLWWEYAIGARGAPMPVLELGPMARVGEIFLTTGIGDTKSPTLRELDAGESYFFAIEDGPAGYCSFAGSDAVAQSSEFLDSLDRTTLDRWQGHLAARPDADVGAAFVALRELAPKLQRFYDRAYRNGFTVCHFGFSDHLESQPREVVLTART